MTSELQVPESTTSFELAVAEGVLAALVELAPDLHQRLYQHAVVRGGFFAGADLVQAAVEHFELIENRWRHDSERMGLARSE